jgi:hypothetical protein
MIDQDVASLDNIIIVSATGKRFASAEETTAQVTNALTNKTNKLRGLSPRDNYTYLATAACAQS